MKITITEKEDSIEGSLGILSTRAMILHKMLEQALDDPKRKTTTEIIQHLSQATNDDNEAAYLILMLGKMYGFDMMKKQILGQAQQLIKKAKPVKDE